MLLATGVVPWDWQATALAVVATVTVAADPRIG
jgi:hypothetical protein